MAQEKKAAPDWERIEADYRAGLLSVREIAASQGVSHVAVGKRAKREEWVRDLSAKIKAKADSLVTNRAVTTVVTTEKAVTDRAIVEANAEVIAQIRLAHRSDIARARALAMSLLGEMEAQTSNLDLFEKLSDLLRDGDDKNHDKRSDLFHKVISSAGRIDGIKKLAETLKTLITLEREAYGISAPQEINLNANIKSERKSQEMTDDELLAIAAGSSAGGADPA